MLWFEDGWKRQDLPRPVVATIGNYDGVHRGQQAILERLVASARAHGLPATVVTFEPHPLSVVAPEQAPERLASRSQKRDLLAASAVDAVVEIRFDPGFAATSAENFVRRFLHRVLSVREVVVGSRFVFGQRQAGDLALLQRVGKELGFAVHGVDEVELGGSAISSSRIRRAVGSGDVAGACAMLGHPFALRGTIIHGERRGKGLGWPTINLQPEQEVRPARGVYLTEVRLGGESLQRRSVTNVGVRPTISTASEIVVESHILDFSRDVYGAQAEVTFIERLRDEQAFENVAALSHQIRQDVERAREFFAERSNTG